MSQQERERLLEQVKASRLMLVKASTKRHASLAGWRIQPAVQRQIRNA